MNRWPAGSESRSVARWIAGLAGSRPPAIVLGASVNGLSFLRSLGRRGVPVLLLDSRRKIGSYSRFATTMLLPAAETHPDAWMEFLRSLGEQLPRKAALFPTSDDYCILVANNRAELGIHFSFVSPAGRAMDRIINKRSQYEDAVSLGVRIPQTHFPQDICGLDAIEPELRYPCILKPYQSHLSRRFLSGKAVVADNASQLRETFQRCLNASVEVMVQEIIPGPDSTIFSYAAFWDEQSRERAWLTTHKIRQNSRFGDGSFQETVEASEVAALGRKYLAAMQYQGFANVEYRLDQRDQTLKLLEINPRTVSGNQLAISAGIDFPWLGYLHSIGELEGLPQPGFRLGTRYVHEAWDVRAFFRLNRAGELSMGSWLRSLRGVEALAIGARDDPAPLAGMVWLLGLSMLRGGGSESQKAL